MKNIYAENLSLTGSNDLALTGLNRLCWLFLDSLYASAFNLVDSQSMFQ